MLNGLAMCLLLTTLATAGVFSPPPTQENKKLPQKNDVIMKEGHRAVMVEFESDGRSNTKVLISPDEHLGIKDRISEKADNNAKEKLKEKTVSSSSALPNVEEETAGSPSTRASPRELVCDAFGKCKHKIASALGRTKDKAYEVEEEAIETAGNLKDRVFETKEKVQGEARETVGKVKDTVFDKAQEAKERVVGVSDKGKMKAHEAKEHAAEKAQEFKQGAMEKAEKLKKGAEDVVDSTKKAKEDVAQSVSTKIEAAKTKGKLLKEEGKKEMKEILCRGRDVIYDVFTYLFPPEGMASSARVMQMFGFSMAFGMSMWVTFFSSYVLAGVLPRQQFAMVQSKMYPVYFKTMEYSIGIALVAHLLSQRKRMFYDAAEMLQGFGLLASLSMVLANLLYLEPRATKVMFERMKLEKEEARGLGSATAAEPGAKVVESVSDPVTRGMPTVTATTTTVPLKLTQEKAADAAARAELVRLSELLKWLNSSSSFLNILTLMFLTWHLVYLGQGGLQPAVC